MEKKIKIADFATLVGTSPKTIYKQIEKGRLITVNEVQNGREIALIVTSDEQIQEFQNMYGKMKVNEGNYEDILTVNEGEYTVKEVQNQQNQHILENSIERLITYNNQLQERLMKVTDEVIESKSRIPLLEDKASREGMYLQEIKDLKDKFNSDRIVLIQENRKARIPLVIACLILLILCCTLLTGVIYLKNNPQEKQVTKIITVDANGKPISILTEKNPAK